MGGYPLLDAGKTPEGTLSLLFGLLDQLPVSVAVYGAQAGFPLLYCNPRMAERREAVPPDLDLTLFQSKEIARLHGGEIEAASALGRSSRFDLTLPLREASNGTESLEESK